MRSHPPTTAPRPALGAGGAHRRARRGQPDRRLQRLVPAPAAPGDRGVRGRRRDHRRRRRAGRWCGWPAGATPSPTRTSRRSWSGPSGSRGRQWGDTEDYETSAPRTRTTAVRPPQRGGLQGARAVGDRRSAARVPPRARARRGRGFRRRPPAPRLRALPGRHRRAATTSTTGS